MGQEEAQSNTAPTPALARKGSRGRPTRCREVKHLNWWADNARRGDWCIYWDGFLMRDREVASLAVSPDVAEAYRRRAHNMAEAAWNVYRSNKVILCQTRLAEGRYFYHAVKK